MNVFAWLNKKCHSAGAKLAAGQQSFNANGMTFI
jgi:hypothetical protein